MRYTIQHGVEHQFSEHVNDNVRFILPLLVILAGVTFFLLNPYHFHKSPAKPFTLGIYTVKTPDNNSKSTSNDNNGSKNTGSSTNLSGSGQIATVNPQTTVSGMSAPAGTSSLGSSTSTLPTGGMGGGGSTPTPSVTPPAVTTPVATVVCTNTSAVPIVCTACTVPITLMAGQKALLSSDGTCTAIDP